MHYQSGHTAGEVARYLDVSPSTVSRLLAHAKRVGIVQIRVREDHTHSSILEAELRATLPGVTFHIVEVHPSVTAARLMDTVAAYAAHVVTDLIEPYSTVGLAWGNTVSAVIRHLRPHPVRDVSVVQLNGAGDRRGLGIGYAADIIVSFAERFSATEHLFPVPAFFDYPETKVALWRERSIQHILGIQRQADTLLFSTGALVGDTSSYVYAAGYLTDEEVRSLRQEDVIGDIATVFFRESGSEDLPINLRASGPPLSAYRRAARSVCVACGPGKVPGLASALRAGFISDLIVDERTAAALLDRLRAGTPHAWGRDGPTHVDAVKVAARG